MLLNFAVVVFGVSYDNIRTAPFNPRVHMFGNTGVLGGMHAMVAPAATWAIDMMAYNGRNVRRELARDLRERYVSRKRLVEMGCGTGTLTQELSTEGFDVHAVDTSPEMIRVGKSRGINASMAVSNAIDVDMSQCDMLVACMLFHELPGSAHVDILRRAAEFDVPVVIIADIASTYTPSQMMLLGEPYVPEFLRTFDATTAIFCREYGYTLVKNALVRDRVEVWTIERL